MQEYSEAIRWLVWGVAVMAILFPLVYFQAERRKTDDLYVSVFRELTGGEFKKTKFLYYSAGGTLATGVIRGYKVGLSPGYASICLNRKGIRKLVFGNWKTIGIRMVSDGNKNIRNRLADAYSELIEYVENYEHKKS